MDDNLWTTVKSQKVSFCSILDSVAGGQGQLCADTPLIVWCQHCPDWGPRAPEVSIMVSSRRQNHFWSRASSPSLLNVSVTITNVTHISHFFSGAIAKTELGAGPGQVLEVEGVVINIEDGHQKRALSNLWHKEVFLLHDCSWLLWMPLHFMILIAWHWPIIKWKVPSLMESWIKKVKKKVEGFFSALLYITHLKGCEPHSNHKSKKISQSQLVLWRQCCGRAGGGVWIPARLSVAWSSRVTPTMRFN